MKRRFLGLLLLAVLMLSGCGRRQYPLGGDLNQVETIELLSVFSNPLGYENEEYLQMEAVVLIEDQETFWEDFREVSCDAWFIDPPWDMSGDVIRITYEDGAVDLIGADGGLYYQQGDWIYRYYYFSEEEFSALVKGVSG